MIPSWLAIFLASVAAAIVAYLATKNPVPARLILTSSKGPSMTADQTTVITVTGAVDKNGNAVPLPAGLPLTWSLDVPANGAITPVAGTLTATFAPTVAGTTTITASATFPSGTVTGKIVETVTPGAPVALELSDAMPTS